MQSRDFHSNRFMLTEVADRMGVHVKTVQRYVEYAASSCNQLSSADVALFCSSI